MAWNPALEGRGIATDEEMQTFLANMKFEIKREEREINDKHETSGKKKIVNLVLYFTPFEGKYLNYVRRFSTRGHGVSNTRYLYTSPDNKLYYNYAQGQAGHITRPKGPGSRCLHFGISIYKLCDGRLTFGRLNYPWGFSRDVVQVNKEIELKPNFLQTHKYKYIKHHLPLEEGGTSIPGGQHHGWVYPRKYTGGWKINRSVDSVLCGKWYTGQTSDQAPYGRYVKRGLIRPLTIQEAARGYMVFFDDELQSYKVDLTTKLVDETIPDQFINGANGYCGYLEWNQQRILTTNCIRGPKNIEHNNRPIQ